MDTFIKQTTGVYTLAHNYYYQMNPGESIRSYDIYVNDILNENTETLYTSGIVTNDSKYDSTTVIFNVNDGLDGSGYYIKTIVTTNAGNSYNRTTYMTIDETNYPNVWEDFEYRFQTSSYDRNIYIVSSTFQYNQEYHVSILEGLSGIYNSTMEDNYAFWFTSQYCPLFANITTIKLMGGPTVESFQDDTIYRMIYKNSLDIIDIYNAGAGTCYAYNYWGCTPINIPYLFRRYVECKTTYDLLNIAQNSSNSSTNSIGQTKNLGDLSIKYGGQTGTSSSKNTLAAPDLLKRLYDCFIGVVNYYSSAVHVSVKGLYDVSKGYAHPVLDGAHNRVIKGLDPSREAITGPGYHGTHWRSVTKRRSF